MICFFRLYLGLLTVELLLLLQEDDDLQKILSIDAVYLPPSVDEQADE